MNLPVHEVSEETYAFYMKHMVFAFVHSQCRYPRYNEYKSYAYLPHVVLPELRGRVSDMRDEPDSPSDGPRSP